MIIIGAKGFAKEVLEVLHQLENLENVAFFDDVSNDIPNFLYDRFLVLKTDDAVRRYFNKYGPDFVLGLGGPILRKRLATRFELLGGVLVSSISPYARIGSYGNNILEGANIMTGTVITNDVSIGKGVLINLSCTIGHDVEIGDFVEICPDVNISGNCLIGSYSFIGTNSTILPGVQIGKNVIIGAGSVVSKNIPDNSLALGVPAKIIKELESIDL